MEFSLIEQMVCPYCGGGMAVSKRVAADDTRLRYGLVKCHCFEFPIVNGVLMLSLSKGYGGAEEAMQPYVALQVAAIRYLGCGDVEGLKGWIRRHAPLIGALIDGRSDDYLPFSARVAADLEVHSERYLREQERFEFLGRAAKGRPSWPQRMRAAARRGLRRAGWRRIDPARQLTSFYGSRFFGPRTQSLGLQVGATDLSGRILSLCGGHGVFENLLAARGKTDNVVTVDGQLLNLFVIQRYAHAATNLVCHDVQFPLPFPDAFFDGVFSSTCLPEIPAQRSFISEAMRVSRSSGWTWFDSIWNAASGVKRIDPMRDYRFCQNFFEDLSRYAGLIAEKVAAPRLLAANAPEAPLVYARKIAWQTGETAVGQAVADCADAMISFLVAPPAVIDSLGAPRAGLPFPIERLRVSPAYRVGEANAETLVLLRRPGLERLSHYVASRDFAGYPARIEVHCARLNDPAYLLDLYCRGGIAALPGHFWSESRRLADYLPGRPALATTIEAQVA